MTNEDHDEIMYDLNGHATGHMSPSIADTPLSPAMLKPRAFGQAIGGANHEELYWTTDVVYHVIHAYSAKMLQ